jgi:dnd system-associated protein 4
MSNSINQKELFSKDFTVYWQDRYEPVVEYLQNGHGNSENTNSLYKTNVHVIVLAACVGLMHGQKIEVSEKGKNKELPSSVFNNNDLTIYIHLIALLSNDDPDVSLLKDIDGESRAIKIFEEYVDAGLQILNEKYTQGYIDVPFIFTSNLLKSGDESINNELPPIDEIKLF